jgi:hypothetical protein
MNYSLLFPDLSVPSLSVLLSIFVLLVSAFRLAGSPSCDLFTSFPSLFASVPRTFFECGNSPLGFDGVGAPTLAPESLLSPPGGAESLAGSSLFEFSGFKDIGSPSCGGFLSELIASLVFGLSNVPRTVFECGLELILRLYLCLLVFEVFVLSLSIGNIIRGVREINGRRHQAQTPYDPYTHASATIHHHPFLSPLSSGVTCLRFASS